jgi:DNA-binding transcriptional LysR family regulator
MAGAAAALRVTQPAVSKAIADLEATLGVRLFDRSPQGVTPTVYGDALVKCGSAVFDELRQGIRSIEFLADPTSGELTVGCPESIAATILPTVIQNFSERYPGVTIRVEDVPAPADAVPVLNDRKCDLVVARPTRPLQEQFPEEFNVEVLFQDELVVVAGLHSRWAQRRKVDLADLVDVPWILMAPNSYNYGRIAEAFDAQGLKPPKVRLITFSVHLRTHLLAHGPFVAALPKSVLHFNRSHFALKILPVELPLKPWPVAIVTLKNRTVSPVVGRFIECVRDVAKSWRARRTPT